MIKIQNKKCRIFGMFLILFVLIFGSSAMAGFKKMPNGRYRYYVSKTKYLKGVKHSDKPALQWTFKNIKHKGKTYTYCFDEKGYMLTGWKKICTSNKDGNSGWFYYYFDRNGRMVKNSYKNTKYLQQDGKMLTNAFGPDGTYYGANGLPTSLQEKEGFQVSKKGTRYKLSDGTYAAKCWKCIKDPESGRYYWHYFYSSGYMAKSCKVGSHTVDSNGRMIG